MIGLLRNDAALVKWGESSPAKRYFHTEAGEALHACAPPFPLQTWNVRGKSQERELGQVKSNATAF